MCLRRSCAKYQRSAKEPANAKSAAIYNFLGAKVLFVSPRKGTSKRHKMELKPQNPQV